MSIALLLLLKSKNNLPKKSSRAKHGYSFEYGAAHCVVPFLQDIQQQKQDKKQDQKQDQKQNQEKQKDQKQEEQKKQNLNREEAERMLDALNRDEKELRKKTEKKASKNGQAGSGKDW